MRARCCFAFTKFASGAVRSDDPRNLACLGRVVPSRGHASAAQHELRAASVAQRPARVGDGGAVHAEGAVILSHTLPLGRPIRSALWGKR